MNLHICVLWGLLDLKEVPKNPPNEILVTFVDCFSTETSLYQCREGPLLIPLSLVQIGSSVSVTNCGQIAIQVRKVEEHMLEYIQACLARFGLICWCPDLCQTPYALYNAACWVIALDTFKQAHVSHAYAHMKPNTTYAKDMTLLICLYDHFVHHYLYLHYKKDCRNPGSVKAAVEASPQYCGCTQVRTSFTNLMYNY